MHNTSPNIDRLRLLADKWYAATATEAEEAELARLLRDADAEALSRDLQIIAMTMQAECPPVSDSEAAAAIAAAMAGGSLRRRRRFVARIAAWTAAAAVVAVAVTGFWRMSHTVSVRPSLAPTMAVAQTVATPSGPAEPSEPSEPSENTEPSERPVITYAGGKAHRTHRRARPAAEPRPMLDEYGYAEGTVDDARRILASAVAMAEVRLPKMPEVPNSFPAIDAINSELTRTTNLLKSLK